MSTDTDAPDSLVVELPVVPATFSTAAFLADALGIDDEDVPTKPEGAALLIILEALYWPWRNPDSRAVYVADRRTWDRPTGGVLQELEKEEVQQGVLSLYALLHDGQPASLSVYRNALQAFAGSAKLLTRVAGPRVGKGADGAIWLDLGRADEQAVRITGDGWTVEPSLGAFVRRTSATREVPIPTRGGSVDALWPLITVTPADRPLIRAWMSQSLVPGMTPCPVVFLLGEQGSAKSTSGQMIGESACDSPGRGSLATTPRDFMVTTAASWTVMVDNVSRLDVETSDAICRVVTGDRYRARKLRTDGDAFEIAVRRPLIFTGIDSGILRGDLSERTLTINLDRMKPEQRRDERSVWADFHTARPGIMGAVLDDLVHVLGAERPEVTLPRMADFALTAAKLDVLHGTDSLERWAHLASQRAIDTVANDPLWMTLTSVIKEPWEGPAAALLKALDPHGNQAMAHGRIWPTGPQSLTGWLKRGAPSLRLAGWAVELAPPQVDARASLWRLTPPVRRTGGAVAADGHPVGCRCEQCTKASHPAGCQCSGCTDF